MIDNAVNPTLKDQYRIFRDYMLRLCDFDHVLKNAAVKIFLEKKSDLREAMTFLLQQ